MHKGYQVAARRFSESDRFGLFMEGEGGSFFICCSGLCRSVHRAVSFAKIEVGMPE